MNQLSQLESLNQSRNVNQELSSRIFNPKPQDRFVKGGFDNFGLPHGTYQKFINNPFLSFGGVVGGGWKELGRTTLGSANASLSVGSLSDKRYYMILADYGRTGSGSAGINLNADSGANYAFRYSVNGGADGTGVSDTRIFSQGNGSNVLRNFLVGNLANYSTKEKLVLAHAIENQNGATNASDRYEIYGKHAQTSNPISTIALTSTTQFDIGSELVVLEYDPADTHTTNFWTELASVTRGSDATTLDSGTIAAKKYLWIQIFGIASAAVSPQLQFNADSGANYANRINTNNGGDSTNVSETGIQLGQMNEGGTYYRFFINIFIVNNSTKEKLVISHFTSNLNSGAGNAQNRDEVVAKWTNTSAQITDVLLYLRSAGNLMTGTTMRIWGSN